MASGLPDYYRGFDLAIQSLSTLAVDVAAQSIEQLNVDLVAQTLDRLDIDIIAQTIGNLTIDIAAQNLSEIINRPKYGGAQRAASTADAWANDTRSYITVSGKGMLYGGSLFLEHTASQKTGKPILMVDGVSLAQWSFEDSLSLGMVKPWIKAMFLTKYDDVNFVYCVAFMYGITFETSLQILYEESEGETPNITAEFIFAVV